MEIKYQKHNITSYISMGTQGKLWKCTRFVNHRNLEEITMTNYNSYKT